jgi:Ca-activated chloride channel family protein
MIEASSFIFIPPLWLLMLPPLWALAALYLYYGARLSSWTDICESRLLNLLAQNNAKNRQIPTLALIIFPLLTLVVIALSGPSWEKQRYPLLESAAARVIIIDLS